MRNDIENVPFTTPYRIISVITRLSIRKSRKIRKIQKNSKNPDVQPKKPILNSSHVQKHRKIILFRKSEKFGNRRLKPVYETPDMPRRYF